MDIDNSSELKKRKVEEEEVREPKKLEDVLKRYMEAQKEMVEVLVVLFQKTDRLEKVFSNPLIKD